MANPKKERKAERWPLSPSSKLVADAANEALGAARQLWIGAQERHQSRLISAMRIDGLPTDTGEFIGAKIQGEEWVEILPGEVQQ